MTTSTGPFRDFYRDISRVSSYLSEAERKTVELVVKSMPKRVLDVGCADGEVTSYIKRVTGAEVYGIDISDVAVELALKRGIPSFQCDIVTETIPFEDDYFDVVRCGETIEHLYDPDFALKEIRRVLRQGGFLILSTPNLGAWYNRLLLLFGLQPIFTEVSTSAVLGRKFRLLGQCSKPVGHLRVFTWSALRDLLHLYHFEVLNCQGCRLDFGGKTPVPFDRVFSKVKSLASILVVRARAL